MSHSSLGFSGSPLKFAPLRRILNMVLATYLTTWYRVYETLSTNFLGFNFLFLAHFFTFFSRGKDNCWQKYMAYIIPVRYFSNRSGYWYWYRENGQNIDIVSILFRNRGLQNINIDIEFETEATRILILILNSKQRPPEYWFWYWIRNRGHQNIDIGIEFETAASRILILVLLSISK